MTQKEKLTKEAEAKGIKLTGDETVSALKKLLAPSEGDQAKNGESLPPEG